MNDDTVPVPRFSGAMIPLPKGHPARPVRAGAAFEARQRSARREERASIGATVAVLLGAVITLLALAASAAVLP